MFKHVLRFSLILLVALSAFDIARAQVPEGYITPIPESIMTPDEVDTRLGNLEFFDGVPTQETADRVLENLLFLRGVETFLNGIPAASIEAIRRGLIGVGAKEAHHLVVTEKLMDSKPLFLTANTGLSRWVLIFSERRLRVQA